jgi:hypothetical protein
MRPFKRVESLRRVRGFLLSRDPQRLLTRSQVSGVDVFDVPSGRFNYVHYSVFVDEDGTWVCTCEDFRSRKEECKHIFEVVDRFYPELAPPIPTKAFLHTISDPVLSTHYSGYSTARRFKHKPHEYKEGPAESTSDDQAYEIADERVEQLALEVATILNDRHPIPYNPNGGRPTLPAGDRVLVTTLRFHHRKSLRAFKPIMKRLGKVDPLTGIRKVRFDACKTSLVKYQNDPDIVSYLQEAFAIIVDLYDNGTGFHHGFIGVFNVCGRLLARF